MVYGEAGVEAPKLNLTFLCDNRFLHFILHLRVKTLPGWRSTSWKCRSVSAQESRSWTSPCSTSPSTTRMRQQLLSWASPAPCTLSLRWKFRGFEEDLLTLLARSWEILKFNTWMTRRPSGRASKACRPTWPGSASTRWWASPSRPCPPSRWTAGRFLFTNANTPYTYNTRCLNTLELYVDNIFVVNQQMTLEQAAQETVNPPWHPSLIAPSNVSFLV